MKIQKLLLASAISLFLINIVSAYNSWGYSSWYYNFSPAQLLNNEWVLFGVVFALVFALVYLSLSRTFLRGAGGPGNIKEALLGGGEIEPKKGPVIVISLVAAFLIAAAFSQKAFLYGYAGENLVDWILFAALIMGVVLGIAISLGAENWAMKIIGIIATLLIAGALINYTNAAPDNISIYISEMFGTILGAISGFIFGILMYIGIPLLIIYILIKILKRRGKGNTGKRWEEL